MNKYDEIEERMVCLEGLDQLSPNQQQWLYRMMDRYELSGEPPRPLYFIFTCFEHTRIIEKLKMRTNLLRLNPLPELDTLKVLMRVIVKERVGYEIEAIELVHKRVGPHLGHMLNMVQQIFMTHKFMSYINAAKECSKEIIQKWTASKMRFFEFKLLGDAKAFSSPWSGSVPRARLLMLEGNITTANYLIFFNKTGHLLNHARAEFKEKEAALRISWESRTVEMASPSRSVSRQMSRQMSRQESVSTPTIGRQDSTISRQESLGISRQDSSLGISRQDSNLGISRQESIGTPTMARQISRQDSSPMRQLSRKDSSPQMTRQLSRQESSSQFHESSTILPESPSRPMLARQGSSSPSRGQTPHTPGSPSNRSPSRGRQTPSNDQPDDAITLEDSVAALRRETEMVDDPWLTIRHISEKMERIRVDFALKRKGHNEWVFVEYLALDSLLYDPKARISGLSQVIKERPIIHLEHLMQRTEGKIRRWPPYARQRDPTHANKFINASKLETLDLSNPRKNFQLEGYSRSGIQKNHKAQGGGFDGTRTRWFELKLHEFFDGRQCWRVNIKGPGKWGGFGNASREGFEFARDDE